MNATNSIRFILFILFWISIGNAAANGTSQDFISVDSGFACGSDITCDPAAQYCYVMIGGPKGVPPGYHCVDVPSVTSPLTCETIPDIGIGCNCTESDSGVTVTCTAP